MTKQKQTSGVIGRKKVSTSFKVGVAIGALTVGGVATRKLLFSPLNTDTLVASPETSAGYEAAVEKFNDLSAQEGPEVNPDCRSQLYTHGQKTEKAILLLHGITNCPKQFVELGKIFHNKGYNVVIPRMPMMGMANTMTEEYKNLTAEDLKKYIEDSLEIVLGLGENVTVLGLSAGGVLAAWVAQFCSGVDRVVIIAPSLWSPGLPIRWQKTVIKLMTRLPNYWTWNKLRDLSGAPKHIYMRQSTRALGQMFRLALPVLEASLKNPPAASAVFMVLNDNDLRIDNKTALQLIDNWKKRGGQLLDVYRFDVQYKLQHDLIDPGQRGQNTDLVYPVLIDLVTREIPTETELTSG